MALHAIYWYLHCSLDDGAADAASLRYCAGVVRCVAHAAGWRSCAGVADVDGAAHQPAGALMVVLPMEHAHAAGWCSYGSVADGACSCSWLVFLWLRSRWRC